MAFLTDWHPGWLEAVILAVMLQFVLLRCTAEGRVLLRQNIVLAVLVAVASLLGEVLPLLQLRQGGAVFARASELVMGILLIRLTGLVVFRGLLPRTGATLPRIVEDILLVLAYVAWCMVRLRNAGLDLGSLVTTSALITAIIAFSMQETLGNILGGIALQLDNSVRIGDWIKVDDVRGKVIEIHWRHTAVQTNNGNVVVIPNSMLMKSKVDVFSSSARPDFRRWIYFQVDNNISPHQVIPCIEKALCEAEIACMSHQPAPQCIVMDYKDGWIIYAARYWLTDPRHDDGTDSAVRMHIFTALQRQGLQLGRPMIDARLIPEDDAHLKQMHEAVLAERLQALQDVPLFAPLSDEERRRLAASLRDTPFSKGDVMTRQGAVAHWLYILVQGEADVLLELEGERRLLTTLQAGAVFGEMGLMTGEARRATVVARSDALCYRLDKSGFQAILQERPEIAADCAAILAEREHEIALAMEQKAVRVSDREERILAGIRRFFGLSS